MVAPRLITVHGGMRHCAPYEQWHHTTFPPAAASDGLRLEEALELHFSAGKAVTAIGGTWHGAGRAGRLELRRQERDSAFSAARGDEVVLRGDRVRGLVLVSDPSVGRRDGTSNPILFSSLPT